jgi:hypothetical protein
VRFEPGVIHGKVGRHIVFSPEDCPLLVVGFPAGPFERAVEDSLPLHVPSPPEHTVALPGHGSATSMEIERRDKPFLVSLRDGNRLIRANTQLSLERSVLSAQC